MRITAALVLSLSWVAGALAVTVEIRDGNVIVIENELSRQVTHTGHDRQPSLSADGNWIIFVRDDPTVMLDGYWEPRPKTSIWIVSVDGKDARQVANEGVGDPDKTYYGGFTEPQFLSDGQHFVFLMELAAVSRGVVKGDRTSGKLELLCGGNSLEVIHKGRYVDHLIVQKHKYFMAPGTYDWYWLLDSSGKEIGPIAESDDMLEEFKQMYVED